MRAVGASMTEGPTDSESEKDRGARDDRDRVEQAVRNLQAGVDAEHNFDFLFRRFSPSLHRQLIRWGADADEARDLNQETFQRIFQDVDRFRGGERLFASWVAWIWTIARTTWLRSLRAKRARKRPQNPQPLEGIDETRESRFSEQPRQLDRVLARDLERRVRGAVDELPEQEGKCVILYYFQGLRTREIAVVLRIAQGTVKAHLSHARAKLKTRLGGWTELENDVTGGGRRQGEARA